MNIKRIIIAGIVVNMLSFFVAVPSYKLFGWVFELEPAGIWKWTPNMSFSSLSGRYLAFVFFINTILSFYVVFLYAVFQKIIRGTPLKKGILFALLIYPAVVLIPELSAFAFINIAPQAIIYFMCEGLFETLVYSIVIALIYR